MACPCQKKQTQAVVDQQAERAARAQARQEAAEKFRREQEQRLLAQLRPVDAGPSN